MTDLVLRGVPFKRAWNASGALGFFGEGYWFHKALWPLGLAPDFRGATFVSKTCTCEPLAGNMPLDDKFRPKEWTPGCIRVDFSRGAVLNAVGLSNPGLPALLHANRWQRRREPFFISIATVAPSAALRLADIEWMARYLRSARDEFAVPFGVQLNWSCPNTDVSGRTQRRELLELLAVLRSFLPGVPLVPKLSVLLAHEIIFAVSESAVVDAVCVGNSIPYDRLVEAGLSPLELFGAPSPLFRYALSGGGVSGAPLTFVLRDWLESVPALACPVVISGGVMAPEHATALFDRGAQAVEIGSCAITRPWRVKRIVAACHAYHACEDPPVLDPSASALSGE